MSISHAYLEQVGQPVADFVRSPASGRADRAATLAEAVPFFRGGKRRRIGHRQKREGARSRTREGEPQATSHSWSWRGGLLGRQSRCQRAVRAQRRDVPENQRWQRRPRIRAHGKIEGVGPRRAYAPQTPRIMRLNRCPQLPISRVMLGRSMLITQGGSSIRLVRVPEILRRFVLSVK